MATASCSSCMHFLHRLFFVVVVSAACAPASQIRAPLAPLPEPPAESPLRQLGEAREDAGRYGSADLDALRARGLMVPVLGVSPARLIDSYDSPRAGGRRHEALDILAPRGTAVLAADDGVVVRVGKNVLGGNVIWATDVARRFAYYYAHLDGYAHGLREGQTLSRGDLIGFVGTTGNAPPDTPHLHFQIMRLLDRSRFNDGLPFNALPFFTSAGMTR